MMLLVESQGSLIGSAHFEKRSFGLNHPGPAHDFRKQRRSGTSTPGIRPNREIQDFDVASGLPRDQEANHLSGFAGYPSGHFPSRDALVVPQGPLRNLRTHRLN